MSLDERFNFYHLDKIKFPFYEKKSTKEFLTKWSMSDGICLQGFSFDRPFKKYLLKDFVHDFFVNQNVLNTLQRSSGSRSFVPLGIPGETLRTQEIRCTQTSMDFFDRLTGPIVREGAGAIRKCVPEYYKSYDEGGDEQIEIEIPDELRKMFLKPDDSDAADLFTPEEQEEFLYKIFQHFVVGGSLCQFEDYIQPYLDVTKGFYKELVAVENTKNKEGQVQISTTSTVIQVLKATCDSYDTTKRNLLFPRNQYNNFFYMIIDPNKRICYTLYHQV